MKPHLDLIFGMLGLATVAVAPKLIAADSTTTYSATATKSYVPLDHSRSVSMAASTSNAVLVALNAQALLLKEMLQEHQSRAAELQAKNISEKAKWESELVNELLEKSARVQKSADEMSQPGAEAKDLKPRGADVDEELVFLSTVEARLEQSHQELSAAIEDSRVLSMQVSTNKSPEDIGAISAVLSENQRVVKELQKEQLDLELRKLEFRAIRRAMHK
jgi:arginine deiminase